MSGTICCIFLPSRTTPHSPAATFLTAILFSPQESNLRCREELRQGLRLGHKRRQQRDVVSFHVKAYWWDKIIRVICKTRRVRERDSQVWTWEERNSKSGRCSVQHASGNREYDSENSGSSSNTLASGNREYVQKVVQNMTGRLRRDGSITETSMNSGEYDSENSGSSSNTLALETESTCRKSFKTWQTDSDVMEASRKHRWIQRDCTFQYGRDLWLHRCKQRCTWIQVAKRSWKYSRILNLRTSKVCSVSREWWLKEIQKLRMYFPQTLRTHFGKNPYCWEKKQWSGQQQEYTFIRTPCYAWGKCTFQNMQ